jgi:hypothetical protein
MAVPVSTNTTCDVYRSGNAPPAAPDVPGVKIYLAPKGATSLTTQFYTHVLLCDVNTDIRDNFVANNMQVGTAADKVYVPDQNGVAYTVLLVRRVGRGTAVDHKQVLLLRQQNVTWPTTNV